MQGKTPLTQLVAEQKIDLLCGPVLLPDNSPVPSDSKKTKGTYVLYQGDAAGGVWAWDDSTTQWVAGAPTKAQDLYPLSFRKAPGPGYWGSTLMAIGQKDAGGKDKFASLKTTGLPVYYVVCSFTYTEAGGQQFSGASLSSSPVAILAPGATTTASVDVQPLPPAPAQSIKLFLNDPAGPNPYQLLLQLQPPYAELFAAGASIRIGLGGDIVLTPAPGRKVLVSGALDASGGLFVNGLQVT
jgi:hypothetical protein